MNNEWRWHSKKISVSFTSTDSCVYISLFQTQLDVFKLFFSILCSKYPRHFPFSGMVTIPWIYCKDEYVTKEIAICQISAQWDKLEPNLLKHSTILSQKRTFVLMNILIWSSLKRKLFPWTSAGLLSFILR